MVTREQYYLINNISWGIGYDLFGFISSIPAASRIYDGALAYYTRRNGALAYYTRRNCTTWDIVKEIRVYHDYKRTI
jgi:hypothetical protein